MKLVRAQPEPSATKKPIDIRSAALTILAVVAVVLVLQYAQSVIIPIVLGLLISYALDPLVAWMAKRRVPRPIGAALVITTLEGFLLTPWLTSRAARMNAIAVFIGLLFWGWIWNVWGMLLAVLVVLKAICDHVDDLEPIGELLGE